MDFVFELDRVCDRHGAYRAKRWVLPGGGELVSPCQTCRAEADEAKRKSSTEAALFDFRLRLSAAGVGARYHHASFENYRTSRPEERLALDTIQHYAATFRPRQSLNLILYGRTGTGKTHLACAVARDLLLRGFTVSYLPILTLFSQYQDISSMANRNEDTREAFFARLRAPDLLIVDEFGIASMTEREKIVFHRVIDERYNRNTPICLVGNTDAIDFRTIIGERADRRVMGSAEIIEFKWDDEPLNHDLFSAGEST